MGRFWFLVSTSNRIINCTGLLATKAPIAITTEENKISRK